MKTERFDGASDEEMPEVNGIARCGLDAIEEAHPADVRAIVLIARDRPENPEEEEEGGVGISHSYEGDVDKAVADMFQHLRAVCLESGMDLKLIQLNQG